MWIFHPNGFVSVVEHPNNPAYLEVRGRTRNDLKNLFPSKKIYYTPKRDYQYRVIAPRQHVIDIITNLVKEINYYNFKDTCPKSRHKPYLNIWIEMYQFGRKLGDYARKNKRDPEFPLENASSPL